MGRPSANTLYEVSIPASMQFGDTNDGMCCSDYLGYHYDAMIGGVGITVRDQLYV